MSTRLPHLIFVWVFLFLITNFYSLDLSAIENYRNVIKKKSEKLIDKAKKAIENNQYVEAEDLIFKAINADSTNIKAFLILSDISDELKKTDQKKMALTRIVSLDSINFPLANKLLATILFEEGNYTDALPIFNQYRHFKIRKDSVWVEGKINSCCFALNSLVENRKVQITHFDTVINTPSHEYWPAISTDDSLLYFTRLIENDRQYPYERIFISEKNDSSWENSYMMNFPEKFDVNIGGLCLSADGNYLFFTACGRKDGKGSCDIYYAMKKENTWSVPINAGSVVNSKFWEAQPSISSDNKHLYFVSNRTDGFGKMDIWCSEITNLTEGNLHFKTPLNLGNAVNSIDNDFSPFIHADGTTLYFSSDGRSGMGGSDIFLARLKDSAWIEPVNLGYPINSRFNEDGLVVSPTANIAVFSSNREGSVKASKDLYQIKLPIEFLPERVGYIQGFVYDIESGSRILATIVITQLESKKSKEIFANLTDGYITTLVANKTYAMDVNIEGYLFYSRHFNLKENVGFQEAERVDVFLEPIKAGKRFILSNIFFDFDSDSLKNESYSELNQLSDFLQKNSKLKVEISGHTDNIGRSEYNIELSEKRAKAIFDFLLPIIGSNRMIYKGYGSEMPVSSNDEEKGRALNRRSEIKILAIK